MDLHWRNTMKPARFFAVDARSAIAILLVLVHARYYTFAIAIIAMVVFWIVERLGYRFEAALRALRNWFVAPDRPAIPLNLRRTMTDLSRRPPVELSVSGTKARKVDGQAAGQMHRK